jgi:hypothetical protein
MPSWRERHAAQYAEVARAVEQVPPHITSNVLVAWRWAKDRLMRREGDGHCFHLHRKRSGISCSFAKPEWAGDHAGEVMPTGALAIVQAVLEYEHGL